ncbi:MAG: tetratricopeptide repeat protein [Candidatus Omnitrophota bacterium]|nr:tetratricopeptide repeat protein [Candidatus Omnitrophota bacterium]
MTQKLKTIIFLFLILILTSAAFLPSLKNGFVNWDDDVYVTENPLIKNLSWGSVKEIFSSFHQTNYHPLALFSYALEYHFFGLNPRAYHATNLILHLFNCLLVFWLIWLIRGRLTAAFIVALLFGIHPLHVESVAWVAERRDVLYAAFFLSSLVAYVYYIRERKRHYYWLSISGFILSLLSKAMAVSLPFLLLLLDWQCGKRINRESLREKIPFFALAAIFAAATLLARQGADVLSIDKLTMLYSNLCLAGYGPLFYIIKTFLPFKLSCVYPYGQNDIGIFKVIFFFSPALLMALLVATFSLRNLRKRIAFGALFYLICLSPAIIQMLPATQPEFIVADRYFYLASIGIFLLLADGLSWLYARSKRYARMLRAAVLLIFPIILSVLAALTWNRCLVWRDSVSLWTDVLARGPNPNSATAYINRGTFYLERKEYNKAYVDFMQAFKIEPNAYEPYFNLASLNNSRGHYETALWLCGKALEINPGYLKAYNLLVAIYGKMGRHQEAVDVCRQLVERYPAYAQGYTDLCSAYGNTGNYTEAIKACQQALEIEPTLAVAHLNLAAAYYYLKQYDLAIKHCDQAVSLGFPVCPKFLEQLKPHRK